MRLILDTSEDTLTEISGGTSSTFPLFSAEAFHRLSHEWMRIGWSLKYYHRFAWLGYPLLQLPEHLIRLQEAIFRIQPDVIVETGVFAGGFLSFPRKHLRSAEQGKSDRH